MSVLIRGGDQKLNGGKKQMIKKQIISAALFLGAVLLASSVVYAPFFGFAAVIITGILFAVSVITAYSPWVTAAEIFAALLVFSLVSGYFSAAMLLCVLFVPVGASVGFAFRKKLGFNQTVQISVFSSILAGVLSAVVFIADFSDPFSVKTAFAPFSDALKAYLSSVTSETGNLLASGTTTQDVADVLYKYIVYNIPAWFMLFVLLSTVVCYWSVKNLFKRTTEPVAFMGRFDSCRISVAGTVFYFVATVVYMFSSGTVISATLSNFTLILTYMFAYAGISLIAYLLDFKEFTPFLKGVIVAVVVAFCILPLGLASLVALLGAVDSYLNIRERLQNKGV